MLAADKLKSAGRFTPLKSFPLTEPLSKCYPRKKQSSQRSHIVSDVLCDDILHRLSPFLKRNAPVDILDLWPGAGLWSSKVNNLLKPRRHVMIEPELSAYGKVLNPLVQGNNSYELHSIELVGFQDWYPFLQKYFPEQGPSCTDVSGPLPKNDTLLVLANIPPNNSKRSHHTPARWLAYFLDLALRRTGFHMYGSVRLVATLPSSEVPVVLSRTVSDRKRPSLLNESLALHTFDVACPSDIGLWTMGKGYSSMVDNAVRVSERAAASKVDTPAGRELPAYPLAPESPDQGQKPSPHIKRVKLPGLDRTLAQLEETAPLADKDKGAKKKRIRACIQLNYDNRRAHSRQVLFEKKVRRDEITRRLSRAAADPKSTLDSLKPLMNDLETISSDVSKTTAETRFELVNGSNSLFDDHRASLQSGSYDDAVLPWDRRPFEPLYIRPEELYPREFDRSMIYFEADANPLVMQKLQDVEPSKHDDLLALFESITLLFSNRSSMSVGVIVSVLFPSLSVNEVIRNVPSLATFAEKKLKPNLDDLPKTPHPNDGRDPSTCFQETLDYDLSDVRLRSLSVGMIWDILLEYSRTATDVSPVHLNRLLGGTLTSYRSGDYMDPELKLN